MKFEIESFFKEFKDLPDEKLIKAILIKKLAQACKDLIVETLKTDEYKPIMKSHPCERGEVLVNLAAAIARPLLYTAVSEYAHGEPPLSQEVVISLLAETISYKFDEQMQSNIN